MAWFSVKNKGTTFTFTFNVYPFNLWKLGFCTDLMLFHCWPTMSGQMIREVTGILLPNLKSKAVWIWAVFVQGRLTSPRYYGFCLPTARLFRLPTSDVSGKGGPTLRYATASTAVFTSILPRLPEHTHLALRSAVWRPIWRIVIMHCFHCVLISFVCISEWSTIIFLTSLNDWSLYRMSLIFSLRHETFLNIIYISFIS
jgi:hypothetical protein